MAAAVITGASTGIGREFARLCAADGYDLILTARSQSLLEALASEIRQATQRTVMVLAKDLSDAAAPRELFDEISRSGMPVELLINNAGFGLLGRFWELDDREQIDMIQVNIAALTELSRLFLPGFVAQRGGRILNVASTAAFQPGPLMACLLREQVLCGLFFRSAPQRSSRFRRYCHVPLPRRHGHRIPKAFRRGRNQALQ